jgi:hypothetical protein
MPGPEYSLQFLKGFIVTQATEIPLAYFCLTRYLRRKGKEVHQGRILLAAFLGNMATLPYLWFVYPEFMTFRSTVIWGEITAVGVEALLYWLATEAGIGASLLASVVSNAGSVLVGLIIMPPF